jgi:hypothetical protein
MTAHLTFGGCIAAFSVWRRGSAAAVWRRGARGGGLTLGT